MVRPPPVSAAAHFSLAAVCVLLRSRARRILCFSLAALSSPSSSLPSSVPLTDDVCARPLAVATHEQLVSKSFQGRHGRAFLFTAAANVSLGPKEERVLMTGLHSVSDIYCSACESRLGWKYLEAFENRCVPCRSRHLVPSHSPCESSLSIGPHLTRAAPPHCVCVCVCISLSLCARSQKYKEGKFIVEKSRVVEGEAM